MDQIQRDKIITKLKKIKALAVRGEGGEKTTALLMYDALKEKYSITDEEVDKAATVPADITQIELKKYWGIAFQLAAVAKTLQEENEICSKCPHEWGSTTCYEECSTFFNIRDLQTDFETIQRRLTKAAMEV